MASSARTETFDIGVDKIYQVLVNYESYPYFIDGFKSVEVVARDGASAKV